MEISIPFNKSDKVYRHNLKNLNIKNKEPKMQGVIIEIGSNLYKAINKENGEKYNLIPRGKLKKEETTPVVGRQCRIQ